MFSATIERFKQNVKTCWTRVTNFGSDKKEEDESKIEQKFKTKVESVPSFHIATPQIKYYHAKWIIRKILEFSNFLVTETPTEFCRSKEQNLWQSPRHSSHRKFHRRKIAENTLLLSIISFTLITVGQCHPNSSHCFNCDDFNRRLISQCPSSLNECGQCSPGYFDDSGSCAKIEVVLGPPEKVRGVEGSDVEIACKFNAKVSCDWTRNGEYVDINALGSRYQYKTQNECTLVIEKLGPIDVGDWQCIANGLRELTSTKVSLENKQEVLVHPEESLNALYGEPIVLTCLFDEPVVCSWLTAADETADYNSVRVFDNYVYVDESKYPKTDCSLLIKSLSRDDEGEWKCRGRNEKTQLSVESRSASLTGCDLRLIPMNTNHIYLNHTAVEGKHLSHPSTDDNDDQLLSCVSEKKADQMRWKVNGNVVKTEKHVQALFLRQNEIQNLNFYDFVWPSIKLECEIINGKDRETLFVYIPNQTKNDVILERHTEIRFILEENFTENGKTLTAMYVLLVAAYLFYKVLRLHYDSDEKEFISLNLISKLLKLPTKIKWNLPWQKTIENLKEILLQSELNLKK